MMRPTSGGRPLPGRSRIVVLLSGLSAHGGIQRYNRTLCKALSEYAAQHSLSLEVLSLHDAPGWHDERYLARPVIGCNGNRPLYALRAISALAKPYGVAISGHVDLGPFIVPFRLLRPRSPIVALAYGIEVWTRLPWHKRAALRAATQVWPISSFTAESLVSQQGVDPGSLAVIPIPLDADFLSEVAACQAADAGAIHSRLLTISRMNVADAGKGIDGVIAALPEVRSRIPDIRYVVVGDGDDRPRLEHLARAHAVDDIVHFAGRVPDRKLHAYLGGADLLVLPSRKEGFGIVFLEAMAYGKPVIAGAHGGSPEVVVDGETGMLVRHGDQAGLVAAITTLLQDAAKRRMMGEAGRRRVHGVYGYDRFRATVARALDGLLGVGGSAPRATPGDTAHPRRGNGRHGDVAVVGHAGQIAAANRGENGGGGPHSPWASSAGVEEA
jgi:phosphatidylinositol alpha-1,6-mannosyltransferase